MQYSTHHTQVMCTIHVPISSSDIEASISSCDTLHLRVCEREDQVKKI